MLWNHYFNFQFFFLINIVISNKFVLTQYACNRSLLQEVVTTEKKPDDGRFALKIKEEVRNYVPGNTYTVVLYGVPSMSSPSSHPPKFTSFYIIAEQTNQSEGDDGQATYFDLSSDDAMLKMSDTCRNMVMQASFIPKTEVEIAFNAPPANTGCVFIKATVVEQKDSWYQDDGALTLQICEDSDSLNIMNGLKTSSCCACDEAKYELAFEGLWSRYTHPNQFPRDSWLTRFSDIIGASHTTNYRFWELGGIATEGLKQVAERGSTRMLEAELKAQSDMIRTIIKARGISYPNMTMGKTFAVFRVDRKKHLISIVSMIDPSPDWIVGVSGLELCSPNCSWIASKVVDLYPYDAGTDSGKTYISPDQPTVPTEKISRINNTHPPGSPFEGPEMKPLARLHLTRQRLYDKSCMEGDGKDQSTVTNFASNEVIEMETTTSPSMEGSTEGPPAIGTPSSLVNGNVATQDSSTQEDVDCVLGKWSEWSACNSTDCNVPGKKTKTRHIKVHPKNNGKPCKKSIKFHGCIPKSCGCLYSPWSHWTSCTATCGSTSFRQRTRTVLQEDGVKPCNDRLQKSQCSLLPCDDDLK